MTDISRYTRSFSSLMNKLMEQGVSSNLKWAVYGAGLSATLLAQGAISFSPAHPGENGQPSRVPDNAFLQPTNRLRTEQSPMKDLRARLNHLPLTISSKSGIPEISLDQERLFLTVDGHSDLHHVAERLETGLISLLSATASTYSVKVSIRPLAPDLKLPLDFEPSLPQPLGPAAEHKPSLP